MDVKRLLLVIPLAVLAYLLVIQWNADYGQNGVEQRPPASVSQNGASNDAAEEGLSAPSSAGGASQGASSMPGKQEQTSSDHMVQVRTDVLDLHIDAQGGDVIYAALPKYKAALNSDQPFVLLSDNQRRSYVAKSGLQLENHDGRITYTPSKTQYSLDKGQDVLTVDLKATIDGVEIIKRFTFDRGRYAVKVTYLLANQSQTPVSARFIGQLARDNSPDPNQGGGPMSMKSFLGATFSTQESNYEKISFEDIREGGFKNVTSEGGWVAMIQHYFTSAWVPRNDQENLYYTSVDSRDRNVAAFAGPTRQIAPGDQATLAATLYVGPKIQDRLEAIAPNLELTVDFGWLWFIANPLFWLLAKIHSLIGNWGWSIVLLTVVVKIVLFPLSAKAYKSMAKMRKMGPEMKRIKEQYGDDRQKMSQEMMKFYQKEKINPLGGCLPIVVQMPVFIALYWMLLESVELRHAPFILWINDLSAQDPYFILPIIMGASMFVQQLLNPTPPDPMQAKIMKMLPVIFTFFFLWFPAGLVIYWICNNVISILQQWIITRKIESDDETGKTSKAKS
ncbi:protein translocase subunit yidC [Chromohalobacter marismortui]|uniref:Membrane protein insertase YidC n=1 Tax=Chromohalobacter marismortui TaxID=42055 RepID=A0A4R7NMZ0_9GAMM|nr:MULTISPECIES: membrane protein insertase YidC [Chromohalobacter]MCI0509465.1 membrane protein insertase YidC [Chromohalobacter sp.]MCI0592641.1 membrane protein insertase YidC [Chromohalobacter sp.]TDU22183.1 protein translocase subunit yidC [Chromohalobacter marismortui]